MHINFNYGLSMLRNSFLNIHHLVIFQQINHSLMEKSIEGYQDLGKQLIGRSVEQENDDFTSLL